MGSFQIARSSQVNFGYTDIVQSMRRYPSNELREGFNKVNGETIYFIPTPSAGLWATKEKLFGRKTGFGAE